ncbi:PREDICTED: rho GTPase-activating protein 26 [Nicrophorus vespilloides]|uniref:Rho GTPase-activating protein 26 n=1 Tax=Nicrophorus vespilloides TaxID=110193 RepID=A0ABM1N8N6_NICVS|nr:PREDICTED: rho GTPase-activating protein 26 [Nicrophorus vespilloides]
MSVKCAMKMGVGLPPLEFTECIGDSPTFRDNLHKHEKELEYTNQQIKRLIKEVKDLLTAAKHLGNCQRAFAKGLQSFTFECIGGKQTDDEMVICKSLHEFGNLINSIEDERDRMLENAYNQVVNPLEMFRKHHIGAVKTGKKRFDKQTAKFCQAQEKCLNLSSKKQNDIKEVDAYLGMAERHFYNASMDYVYLIQEVHERKKFEFVETLLGFMIGWLTFYHQGYEVAKDFNPFKKDLQLRIQKTRDNFEDYSSKLRKRMAEIQKQQDPVRNTKGRKEGYLFLLEKKTFGHTSWTKHYCTYDKDSKEFSMIPYNQLTNKTIPQPEIMVLSSCTRRMSDSIDKRFCFDLQVDSKPGNLYTFQALNELDRKAWMDIMDGKEPTYTTPNTNVNKLHNSEERILDELGIKFVNKCIEVLESRGLEEQGIYRVVGVTSKVTKLLNMGLDRRKSDKLTQLDDPQEWETKTITSALKNYLRNLPEPLMTHRYHNGFIAAVKNDSRQTRINDVHTLIYRIPSNNFEVLKILMKHLVNVAAKSDKNLMTVSNLGVCFGPTLLRPEEETVASIVDLKFYNIVVEILIENYNRIFNSEPPVPGTANAISAVEDNVDDVIMRPSSQLHVDYPTASRFNYHPYTDVSEYTNNGKIYSGRNSQQGITSNCYDQIPVGGASGSITSSLYNVHESGTSPNGRSSLYKSPEMPNGGIPMHHHKAALQRYNNASQSESNLPTLQNYSPSNFRAYGKLENSTSSSNESISSNSRDGGNSYLNHVAPEKSNRSNIGMSYPKVYRHQRAVNLEYLHRNSACSSSSGRSSPTKLRRVRTLYACLGENDGELSFEPNQIITNVKSSQEPGWLEGTLNGKTGLIPENYVEVLP